MPHHRVPSLSSIDSRRAVIQIQTKIVAPIDRIADWKSGETPLLATLMATCVTPQLAQSTTSIVMAVRSNI